MKKYIIVLITALIRTMAVSAQQVWSYADCLEYARTHNISLQKSLLAIETADQNLDEARAQWQPSLDFATNHSYSNYPWGQGNKNSYNSSYGLNAGWTVWNGGERENTIKKNKLSSRIAELASGDILRTLQTDLLQVYLNILYARESISIYEEAVKVSQTQAERARQLMEAGKMSRVDYAQLDAQYEQDRYALVNARATYDTRRMELKQLLELGIDAEVTLADIDWTTSLDTDPLPPIAETYRLAIANDLNLQSLDLQVEASDLDIDIARAGRMPRIALNAGVGTGYFAPGSSFGSQMKQGWNESVGLTLSVPILDNRKTSAAVARAKVSQLNSLLDMDSRLNELSRNVENWYIDTRSARSRYLAAESQLTSAQLTDELANERYRLGYVNILELMTAHNSYVEACHTLLQAKFMALLGAKMIEYYRTAAIEL